VLCECDLLTSARSKDLFLAIYVVFMAFNSAAPALQGWWGFEDMPQRP